MCHEVYIQLGSCRIYFEFVLVIRCPSKVDTFLSERMGPYPSQLSYYQTELQLDIQILILLLFVSINN